MGRRDCKLYFLPDWLLSFVHVKGESACVVFGSFLSNSPLTYTFSVVARPFSHAFLVLIVHLNTGKGGRNGMSQKLIELDGTGQ